MCNMSDINKPTQPISPSDDGWKRVQRIEGYKQKRRQGPPQDEPPNPIFFALFATFFKKFFSFTQKKSKQIAHKKEIAKDLSAFHQALQTLINNDRSHDPAYSQMLSALWHTLEIDCNQLTDSIGPSHPISLKFNSLLDEINRYPPWEEHSLGFYLYKRAGETWLPIPFMEILLSLHLAAKNSPLQNPLESWCHLANDIIDSL